MIRVQEQPFDPQAATAELVAGRKDIGAVVTFLGLVRDLSGEKPIEAMTLEHYPGMTERELRRIEEEALSRWPLQASLVIHRFGRLLPGDPIVFCAVASEHRQAAFEACAFLMDYLKTRAPFWKLEEGPEGASWVDARNTDEAALERWSEGGS